MQLSTSIRNILILLLIWLVVLWFDLPSMLNHLMPRGHHIHTQTHHHNHNNPNHRHNVTDSTSSIWTMRDVTQVMLEGLPMSEDGPMHGTVQQHETPPLTDDPSMNYPPQPTQQNSQRGTRARLVIRYTSKRTFPPQSHIHSSIQTRSYPTQRSDAPGGVGGGGVPPNHLFPGFPLPSKAKGTTAPSTSPSASPSKGFKDGKDPKDGKDGKDGKDISQFSINCILV